MFNIIFILIALYLAWNFHWAVGLIVSAVLLLYFVYVSIPQFYAKNGNALYNEGRIEDALRQYEKAYRTGRASEEIVFTYAVMLLKSGYADKAEMILNAMIVNPTIKNETKYKAKQYRILIHFKNGDKQEALEDAIEIFEERKNTIGYALLGYIKVAMKDNPEETLEFCKEAYDYNSDERDILDNLVVAYINVGDFENAKEIADILLEEHPDFVEARFHSALVYKNLGEEEKASEIIKDIDKECKRTYMTTVSEEEVEELINSLK